ncbi:chloroplast lipoate protein ligase [Epithele typhae]|uniref:chloroplast lipoate protein ligase n=1 Tax=Epithele typhae TaxID=378194 RepID=UPI0020088E09|nr:chloroplast lipoate protein ligase [Epithele typhae]KAH9927490.1 chloroplast lipoate protein ligase [Epithele typhae]
MPLPPIYYHCFKTPLSYAKALALQERIHAQQLVLRKEKLSRDFLFLLEHRPVYTYGRRQTEETQGDPLVRPDQHEAQTERLTDLGADVVRTKRGGETTYHGPGQLVGYPLLDLGRYGPPMPIREYICRLDKTLKAHIREEHGVEAIPSEHTGVFLDHHTKVASIGVQVRHRLTTHGFAFNVTKEPLAWFDHIVACGLTDVKAGHCLALWTGLWRDMVQLDMDQEGSEEELIRDAEKDAITMIVLRGPDA